MKNILIVGKTSYIGNSFKSWSEKKYYKELNIHSISVRNKEWDNVLLKSYDTILYLAGIVHSKKIPESTYYEVNKFLPIKFAEDAKKSGVKHFIFMSTLNVYGLNNGEIDGNTEPLPKSYYGKSKFEAEKEILNLEDEKFKVSIIRPPLVYGPQCPGNYKAIKIFSNYTIFFPRIQNERSMIFVDHLSEFISLIILKKINGIFIPQNENYVCTSQLVKEIRKANNKNTILIPFFLPNVLKGMIPVVNKMFGDLIVINDEYDLPYNYNCYSFEETIKLSK